MTRERDLEVLVEALRVEAKGYREMIAASREQTECLLGGDNEAIGRSLNRQMDAAELSRGLSEQRLALTSGLARELGLGEPCSTGRLLGALPGECEELRLAHSEMREICGELDGINKQNQRLTEHRLDLLKGDFEAMESMIRELGGAEQNSGGDEGRLLSVKA